MNTKNNSSENSPGWNAIDKALEKIYGSKEPEHFAPDVPWNLGGNDPLEGISVYYDDKNGFYHYVTYGLTELHHKESENTEFSGWGFEFTLKIKSDLRLEITPKWPLNFLQQLATIVFNKQLSLKPYQTLSSGPMTEESSTIEGILLIQDRQLGSCISPFGKFIFLQLFGLTEKEYEGITEKSIDRREFIEKEKLTNQFLITDINRV